MGHVHLSGSVYSALYGSYFRRQCHAHLSVNTTQHVNTVFCQINAPAWINVPPTFYFNWPYLKNYWTDLNQIFSIVEFTQLFSSRSDKVKSSFPAYAPGVFIRRNTVCNVDTNFITISQNCLTFKMLMKYMLKYLVHTSVDISTTNDNRTMLQLFKYIAHG